MRELKSTILILCLFIGIPTSIYALETNLSASNDKMYHLAYNEFVYVYSGDGTKIFGNTFVPVSRIDNSEMPDKFPAIIFPNSWAVEEHEYIMQAMRFAEKGYIVLSYSSRGWGFSEGEVNTCGPLDMMDVSAVIDWLIENTAVDENNIGMAGISYGSGLSLLGAAHDPRVKTAVALSCWGNIMEALYGAETPRLVSAGMLVSSGNLTGNMNPEIEQNYYDLLNHKNIEKITTWGMKRSPVSYVDELNSRSVPIYLSPNLQDEVFRPNSVMDFYEKLTGPKLIDVTAGIHATSEASGLIGLPNKVWNNVHDWLDYWLKGIDNGIMDRDPVSIDTKRSDECVVLEDWPSNQLSTETYYLGKKAWWKLNGKLSGGSAYREGNNKINSGILSGVHTGIPVISAFFEAHTPIQVTSWIPGINRFIAIAYESDRFKESRLITGIPTLDIWITPSLPQAQIIAHLYDMDSLGIGTLITHGPLTLHEAEPGIPVKVSVELVLTSYEIPAGHKLVLAIDTYDLNYGIPTKNSFSIKLNYSDMYPSVLNIPYMK